MHPITPALMICALAAMPGTAVAGKAAETIACDVELNVIDPDPAGLNVRASPGASGKIVAVLKPDHEWISVHVAAQRGDWMRIDRAIGINDALEDGERQLFTGDGWVHVRMLGVSELFTGDGTVLRDRPDAKAPALLKIEAETGERTEVLGCRGEYLKVRYGKHIGWTERWCTNERTTCS